MDVLNVVVFQIVRNVTVATILIQLPINAYYVLIHYSLASIVPILQLVSTAQMDFI